MIQDWMTEVWLNFPVAEKVLIQSRKAFMKKRGEFDNENINIVCELENRKEMLGQWKKRLCFIASCTRKRVSSFGGELMYTQKKNVCEVSF